MWVRMALEADAMEEKERAGWIQRSQMRKEKRERSEERVKASEFIIMKISKIWSFSSLQLLEIAQVRSRKADTCNDLKRCE